MAISVMQWVWDHSRSRHGARLVALALADRAREDGTAWPSVAELKRMTGLADRAVQAAIIDLAKLGELEVGYQQGPKGCNRYRVLMTPANSAPPQSLRGSADIAPPQGSPESDTSAQANGQDPAISADPADIAPPQISTSDPAESADGTVKEPTPTSKPSSRRRDLNEGRDDVKGLCAHLADRIEANTGERPEIGKAWLTAARLMLDSDKRTEEQVHRAIDWSQSNEFWRKNVLSMPTLRDKYIRLRMEAEDERRRSVNGYARTGQRGGARQALATAEEAAQLRPEDIV